MKAAVVVVVEQVCSGSLQEWPKELEGPDPLRHQLEAPCRRWVVLDRCGGRRDPGRPARCQAQGAVEGEQAAQVPGAMNPHCLESGLDNTATS